MATIPIQEMTVHSTQLGFAWEAKEAATQTFLKGAVLVWSSGFIQEAGADPSDIAGLALRAGQSGAAAGDKISHFVPLLPGTIIEANLAQAAADTTFAIATHMGAAFGIVKRSTGTVNWVIDSADTTAVRMRIIALASGSKNGDVNARVHAVVLVAATATALVRGSAFS